MKTTLIAKIEFYDTMGCITYIEGIKGLVV